MADNGEKGSRGFKSRLSRADVLLGPPETEEPNSDETLKELQEHEIFWEDDEAETFGIVQSRRNNCNGKSCWSNIFPDGGQRLVESAPVNVPHYWPRIIKTSHESSSDDEDETVLVRPPHEIVAHNNNYNKNASFSVVEGYGRTLKGRDLKKLRDAVFRQTGFAD